MQQVEIMSQVPRQVETGDNARPQETFKVHVIDTESLQAKPTWAHRQNFILLFSPVGNTVARRSLLK